MMTEGIYTVPGLTSQIISSPGDPGQAGRDLLAAASALVCKGTGSDAAQSTYAAAPLSEPVTRTHQQAARLAGHVVIVGGTVGGDEVAAIQQILQ